MKSGKSVLKIIITLAIFSGGGALAGDLIPPGPPGPTMHTLEDIYQKVKHLGSAQTLSATSTVVNAGYYAGTTLESVDPDLVASNIRAGVELFGIIGTYTNESVSPSTPPIGMVLIPAGSFSMGDAFAEGQSKELPVHTVNLSAYYIDQTEVTKTKWDEVYAWAISNGYVLDNEGGGKAANHPVHSVNWYDCIAWANARSEYDGYTPCYTNINSTTYTNSLVAFTGGCNWSANGYRLPTEAEWEKAARGNAIGMRFAWSDTNNISHARANYLSGNVLSYDDSDMAGYHPSYLTGDAPFTNPVGAFAPNGFGLYDMSGNIEEWCWDRHGSTYYGVSPATDPRGPSSGPSRVARGGRWEFTAYYCRVSNRQSFSPTLQSNVVGFRLVKVAQ